MPVDHCVAKIKRNFNASQMAGQTGMPGEKDNIEQTSLKVCRMNCFCESNVGINFFRLVLSSIVGLAKMPHYIQTHYTTGSGSRV